MRPTLNSSVRLVERLPVAACAISFVVASGCASGPPPAPPPPITVAAAATRDSVPPAAPATGGPNALEADRRAREISLRVRNLDCRSLGVGSAVAIGESLIVTNRHVVEGARLLEVTTWDGRTFTVETSEVALGQDLAVLRVGADLPATAVRGAEPAPGDEVFAVGFPGGGPFERLRGRVVDYVDGSVFGEAGRVMRVTIPVRQGNSGGAVLNGRGEMVGVVFAIERRTGHGLVIPISGLDAAVERSAFVPATQGC
ncbi:MAG TPA: serine protease [Dehalococcoidia bacterium]|nr:serine protease [Dehalococcoidia bacterium]